MKARVRDHGPTELYIPEDGTEHSLEYDENPAFVTAEVLLTSTGDSIVFVHGLFGHAQNTWTHKKAQGGAAHQTKDSCTPPPSKKARNEGKELFHECFWPQDLLPSKIPNARIITWGYDVNIDSLLSDTSKASVFQHAETLLADLVSLRVTEAAQKKPIIFVVHSLGGIIIKDALSLSKMEVSFFKEVFPATVGVMFLGTPHRGSKAAKLGKIAFELSRVFLKDPNLKILRALEKDSEILERISRSFGYVLASGRIKVHTFHEELKIQGMEIVESWSSTIGYLHESRSSLHANHRDMTKCSSADDINFIRISSILRRWVDEVESTEAPRNVLVPDFSITEMPDSLIYDDAYRRCLGALNVDRAGVRLESVEPAYSNTYRWLYNDELEFRAWLQGKAKSDIFWVSGKPGSGKSTLMKYALEHKNTLNALRSYSRQPWLITGYFFHDRGTAEQKTVDGFLREILYQMLVQRQDLFALIQDIHKEQNDAPLEISATWWTVERLRQAILDIRTRTTSPLNCCLFVDALDEHDGNHRDLIALLKTLAFMPKSTAFRLRLCVAGRPENIFKDAFNTLPGFAIHQKTIHDIRHYAENRLRTEQLGALGDKGRSDATRIVNQIVRKAQGVFLWVRLVVDELIEGLCEGDTFEELEMLISEIPDELTGLYTHAIRRLIRASTRSSARSSTRHRYETYVIFQIMLALQTTISLEEIINASIFCASRVTAKPLANSSASMDSDQRQRRLNSRSAGLLETARYADDVQFIHQTVKVFISSEDGRNLIKEGIHLKDQEDGLVFTFRYIIQQLEFGSRWSRLNFIAYAQALEGQGEPAARWLDPSAATLWRNPVTYRIAATGAETADRTSTWLDSVATVDEHPAAYLILFCICCNLPLSVEWYLERYRHKIDTKPTQTLFEAALLHKCEDVDRSFACFQSLLKSGMGICLSQRCVDWVDQLLNTLLINEFVIKSPGTETMSLWGEFVTARKSRAQETKDDLRVEASTELQESKLNEGKFPYRSACGL